MGSTSADQSDLDDRRVRYFRVPLHKTSGSEKLNEPGTPLAGPISAEGIKSLLREQLIGRRIFAFNQVGSTNAVAKRMTAEESSEGTLIIADEQTQGRGRLGRRWHSPPGIGLWISVILRPKQDLDKLGLISIMAGVAVAQALERSGDFNPQLKWPNDVLLNSRKVSGVLIEAQSTTKHVSALVVGIGVNVNHAVEDFDTDISSRATSLRVENGATVDRLTVLVELLHRLDDNYRLIRSRERHTILMEWQKRCPFIGKPIVVKQAHEDISGIFRELDEGGGMIVEYPNGRTKHIEYGEQSQSLS